MRTSMLESLVLRGSVRLDGSAVVVRRGTGSVVGQAPEVALLTRHPLPGRPWRFPKPAAWQDRQDANQAAHAVGAGRPRSSGGLKALCVSYPQRGTAAGGSAER
jgi:hypothetical protein